MSKSISERILWQVGNAKIRPVGHQIDGVNGHSDATAPLNSILFHKQYCYWASVLHQQRATTVI
jgi:hypothetical protein